MAKINDPMRIVIRADASIQIGSGHVMRCLAFANRLKTYGARIRFICTDYPGHIAAQIKALGMEVMLLAPDQALDANSALHAMADFSPVDWLVVDHYGLDAVWESAMRCVTRRIMVIDDLADRDHDCDLLLDQNLREYARDRYAIHVPAKCRMLLGPRHALLREEFETPGLVRERDGTVRRLLVFHGSSDPTNEADKTLDALALLGSPALDVQLVLGASNPQRTIVAARAADMHGIRIHEQTSEMARLMSACDLALGTCGVASWERCALGLPALVVITADNQRETARLLHACGAVECLGDAVVVDAESIAEALEHAMIMPRRVAAMARNALAVTAGWENEMRGLVAKFMGVAIQ